ncbi:class I SAM-dependent methyltransferase [Methanobrevibacter millerae]|uniref:Ubiquinone/menaquinone biosynthesis C-methylase UbiE n=1 Tax=Methanobrevibacter millerae TaxID=230361 RepID=A0A1G5WXL6_9EURY|nr:class I SAM-dependent methyltransferase [Methanobrevibacter millerae]SDA62889.1 Ubiquinone/menaquinone biosynthesis C-methylase UbiE [Methanobrevibacter millerae]
MSDDKVNTGHNIEDKELIKNARKPVGELGEKILDRMNESHESMAVWGVSHFEVNEDDIILDIGCGGGRNLERFAEQIDSGKVVGIDYSVVSVEKSADLNEKAIEEGKVEVIQGSVSEMPFDDDVFDIVTGFETIYFWPDFINDLMEVNRVLKKDGLVFFCNEAVYREGEMEKYDDLVELLDMKIYSEDVLRQSLEKTGFKDFKAYINDEKDWICVTARKA